MRKIASYGTWSSPITPRNLVEENVRLGQIIPDGEDLYYLESRPTEKGRSVIVKIDKDGLYTDVNPMPFNARNRVHEYGGGSFCVQEGTVFFSNYRDGYIYSVDTRSVPGGEYPRPQRLTVVPSANEFRYADLMTYKSYLIVVEEEHFPPGGTLREPANRLVAFNITTGERTVLAEGADFYSSPAISPQGKIAWLEWNHPNMPWDGTDLWQADFQEGEVVNPRKIAGGPEESIFQPQFSEKGDLLFISDNSGWWNPCIYQNDQVRPILNYRGEFGWPQWVFGMRCFDLLDDEQMISACQEQGLWKLFLIEISTGKMNEIKSPFTSIEFLRVHKNRIYFVGGAPDKPTALVEMKRNGSCRDVCRSFEISFKLDYLSTPEMLCFPTGDGDKAFGIYYPPANPDFKAPAGELPPLIVRSHGGPTAAAQNTLSLKIQHWTSRGFAVLDVNYRGSTGYGRTFREKLNGNWGKIDVEDCASGAMYLADQDKVDREKMAISGGSAGGYTTIAALTFTNTFKAGASYYGISDLETLARDTHKFESRYLDRLVAPYPEARDTYYQRSPIHFVEKLSCPMIIFQGLQDKVVPPVQSEKMAEALKKKGIYVAYLTFPDEQHGFRQAQTILDCLVAEQNFYKKVFHLERILF